jgi:hypothetical protein
MPGAGATDPANLQAHARAQLGQSRELEQARRVTPHHSLGGRGCQDSSFGTQAIRVFVEKGLHILNICCS